ncbi:rhodanese-like domain-containing protein [Halobacillus shinanisalinarum]|uniref:Rhodanese-like domain-containing protein n=1 Tax=Halobacillus shinanisalinarum TaxID=2932258 RepID=A0ABY4H198_9BACI|nr:rhodanese-like domain-containing protein [Halobacillus shinanisalinarum]UOQ93948.1 rhodanese-like domain-containing protein [Halobacillus shinanisalinarum]
MKEITAKGLEKKVRDGERVNIIDVRESKEVAQGKIPGAQHIPLGQVLDHLDEMGKEKHYYIVCRSGGRSGKACGILSKQGCDVTNMAGGMLDWSGEVEK